MILTKALTIVQFILKKKIPRCSSVLEFLPSFLSALQLRASFGRLNNLPPFFSPSEADYLISEQFVRLLASRPTPNLEDLSIPLGLAPTP
jgi:hypothetical protein